MAVDLTKKEATHGLYKDTALLSQTLKGVLYSGKNWEKLNTSQRESLELICLKISRILNGNPNVRDHWDDVVGYAQLASDSIKPTMPQIQDDIAQQS